MISWLFEREKKKRQKHVARNVKRCNKTDIYKVCFPMCSQPTVSNGSNPPGRFLSSLSICLVGYIQAPPQCLLLRPSFPSPHPRRQLVFNTIPPHSRHQTGMEIRCKSVPTFPACEHLSEPRAPATVPRSVWVTLACCQLGSGVWCSLAVVR